MIDSEFFIVVFSFNRGRFLRNCMASIERHAADASVLIVDDLSDEHDTRAALDALASRYTIMQPEKDSDQHKLGGLYPNMQMACDSLPGNALMCCLQDDMQLVRGVRSDDLQAMAGYFEQNPRAGFLHHAFMKGHQRARYQQTSRFDSDRQVYFRESDGKRAGEFFSAVFTARVDRLRSHGWQFDGSEKANNQRASALFDRMGFMRNPIAHWLPCVPSHRHKAKSWAIRRAEQQTGAGYYPFQELGEDRLRDFLQRDPSVLPIAEDFLTTNPEAPVTPWIYHPLQGASRWLYLAHRLESNFTRR